MLKKPLIHWSLFIAAVTSLMITYGNTGMWLMITISMFIIYLKFNETYFKTTLFIATILWNTFFGNHQDIFSDISRTGLPSASTLTEIILRLAGVLFSMLIFYSLIKLARSNSYLRNNSLLFGLFTISLLIEGSRFIVYKHMAYSMIAFFSKAAFGYLYLLKYSSTKRSVFEDWFSISQSSPIWSIFGRSLVIPNSITSIVENRPKTHIELGKMRSESIKIFLISSFSIITIDLFFMSLYKSPYSFFNWHPGLVSVINIRKQFSFAGLATIELWLLLFWNCTLNYIIIASSWNLAISLANFMGIRADLYWGNVFKTTSISQVVTKTMRLNVKIIQEIFFLPIWTDLKLLKNHPKLRMFISIFLSIVTADFCIHIFRDFSYIYSLGLFHTFFSAFSLWGYGFILFALIMSSLYLYDPINKTKPGSKMKIFTIIFVFFFLGFLRLFDDPSSSAKLQLFKNLLNIH